MRVRGVERGFIGREGIEYYIFVSAKQSLSAMLSPLYVIHVIGADWPQTYKISRVDFPLPTLPLMPIFNNF